ncbi:S-layer homology domain-containing protein [bacterium]|nr:S-layer homology domain-containing protein [bacterium]
MRLVTLFLASIALLSVPCWADEAHPALQPSTGNIQPTTVFKDVPGDHWANDAVDMMAQNDIMHGYPDDTFKGDRHVTRYELCVALANMIQFIQSSQKPIINSKDKDSNSSQTSNWATTSVGLLKNCGFLPQDSPLLKDGNKEVTCLELGDALAQVSAKLIELRVPPTSTPD